MKHMKVFLFLGLAFLLIDKALGGRLRLFFDKYMDEIQEYTMTGHEKGWTYCDILSANPFANKDQPQISMDLEKIQTLNARANFAFSNCLILSYSVNNLFSLEKLLHFGRAAIQHIRLALVIKLNSGITLNMISNSTKLPFMIAAELSNGREQFLCPIVGVSDPILEENVCNPTYTSYKGKRLRITFMGSPPYYIPTNSTTGQFDGTDIRLMRILERQLNFRGKIIMPQSHSDAFIMVCHFFFYNSRLQYYFKIYIFSQTGGKLI